MRGGMVDDQGIRSSGRVYFASHRRTHRRDVLLIVYPESGIAQQERRDCNEERTNEHGVTAFS